MKSPAETAISPVLRYASRLRFPTLFVLTAALFLLDLVFPDLIPFVDELLLGLATLLFGTWRKRRQAGPAEPPTIDARPD